MPPLDLGSLDDQARSEGKPMSIALQLIDEDLGQPRFEFDEVSLQELADSIAMRGVLQPISIRRKPEAEGRWVVNFGARRLRAAKLAGLAEIPVFVDECADSFDQVIENEHRDALRPLELALFVKSQLDRGLSASEIAKRLGKSGPYVSYVSALIDAPDWLLELYRDGRCRGIKELYDLRRMHKLQPLFVSDWLRGRSFVSRKDVDELRDLFSSESPKPSATDATPTLERMPRSESASRPRSSMAPLTASLPQTLTTSEPGHLEVFADVDGDEVRVLVDQVPREIHSALVQHADGLVIERPLVQLNQLRLVRR